MAKYASDRNFTKYEGLGRPKNPKGLFVVPTGSASVLAVSSSIKGGSVGSTKDTNTLLSSLEDGESYEESWHEAVHYLDKRVNEVSNGLNRVADAQANLSGSSATSIATNKVKAPLSVGTGATNAKAGNTTTISSGQASAITANTSKTGISSGQSSAITANTAKVSYDKNLCISKIEGELIDVKMTVALSRGAYSLTFTMAHGETTKSVTLALR